MITAELQASRVAQLSVNDIHVSRVGRYTAGMKAPQPMSTGQVELGARSYPLMAWGGRFDHEKNSALR
jgi:hypothetical protein